MAFNMKRPIIKGTPLHKASIAKAKESIVSQRRTQADASLVSGGRLLGESYIPGTIDFSIDTPDMSLTKQDLEDALSKKGKEKKTPETAEVMIDGVQTTVPYDERFDYEAVKRVKKKKVVKKEKQKEEDVLVGDTESADSKYVAPYVEEAEDEDIIEDAGLDDERTVNPNKKDRGYKNWKVREEERNIAAAEANKAKLDAKSKARKNKASKIEPKKIEQMPTTTPETKLEQAGPAPEAKPGKGKAHNNPDYKAKGPTTNSEGQVTSIGGTPPQNPGYSYNKENDQWTYNDIPVVLDEVPEEFVNSVEVEEQEGYNINLNSNTPSNDSTSVDLLPQPQTNTIAPTNTEQTLTPRQIRERKKQDKKYNDPNTGPKVKATMIEEGYNPIKSKNAEKMRDDRIYRNARKDGPVRRNMIKSGYEPE